MAPLITSTAKYFLRVSALLREMVRLTTEVALPSSVAIGLVTGIRVSHWVTLSTVLGLVFALAVFWRVRCCCLLLSLILTSGKTPGFSSK